MASDGVFIRRATPADALDVLRVLEGALLQVDADTLDDRIASGTVLVVLAERSGDRDPVVAGAAVVAANGDRVDHLEAVAVRQTRRDQGIGTALVERAVAEAAERGSDRVVAEYDCHLRAFYDGLDFEVVESIADGDRYRGVRRISARERE